MKNKEKLIFVCTGNTCRSVMAELIFKKMVSDKIRQNPEEKEALENLEISSAGIAPVPGMNSAPGTVKALQEEGIDASGRKARRLTGEDVKRAALVLVMEERQKHEAAEIAGCCEDKIRRLNEFSNETEDISDPFGHSIETYYECKNDIKRALKKLLEKITAKEILSS
jgi:protein-tyrosine-phosphatase